MSAVRPFTKNDIPQVVKLFQKAFFNNGRPAPSSSKLDAYFEEIFFHNSCVQKGDAEEIPSLVYETSEGAVIGFIGIIPRRMLLNGRPIRAATSMHFMVEPSSRSTLAGIQLLKTFFSGPQDLSLTDSAGALGRTIWEGLGGATALAYSINWVRVLRPSRYVLRILARKNMPLNFLARALKPLCPLLDAMASRALSHRFGKPGASLQATDLDQETLLAGLTQFQSGYAVRPDYGPGSLLWLLARADQMARPGALQKIALRDADGELAGWYLYELRADGLGEVLQVVGRKKLFGEVLNHLFYHGWRNGAIALSGRLDPRFAQEFSDKYCFFNCDGPWTLTHSRKLEVLQAIYQGDLFLSRLEGEWLMRCKPE
jgi:Acetyltransferase (GNAT) domain